MQEFDLPAGILRKTSLIDFPRIISSVFFFKNCNLRCPYCYNRNLVTDTDSEQNFISINQLFDHLEKRKNVIQGLVLSGGEALLNSSINKVIIRAKELGFKIKLDTNGTLPDKIQELISHKELTPDYFAVDIKTELTNYPALSPSKNQNLPDLLKKTINLLSELPPEKVEFRTVLVPSLITEQILLQIEKIIPQNNPWYLSQFINENCLDPALNFSEPYDMIQINNIFQKIKAIRPNTFIR